MKRRLLIFISSASAFLPLLLARAQVDSSTTISVPSGMADDSMQVVSNLFALNSIGSIVVLIVGVLLAFLAIEALISAIRK